MKPGWVFTTAPTPGGTLCVMQTPERMIVVETPFDDDTQETMLMMAAHCVKQGDPGEISPTYH